MTETVIITLLFIWIIKGYKLSDILKLFKHWTMYPVILTCLAHMYFIYLIICGQYWFLEYATYIKTISLLFYIILIFKYKLIDISIFKNINLKKNGQLTTSLTSPVVLGGLCTIIGSQLNKMAMFYNNGKMPVFPTSSLSIGYSKIDMFEKTFLFNDFHILGNYITTKLIFLCDTWDIFIAILSPGDIFIRFYVSVVLYYSIKQHKEMNIIIDK